MKQLSYMVTRLLALYFLLKGLMSLMGVPFILMGGQVNINDPVVLVQLAGMLLPFFVAGMLWCFATFIARQLYIEDEGLVLNIRYEELLATGMYVLGLYFMISAVPELYSKGAKLFIYQEVWNQAFIINELIGGLLQFVLGLVLIVKKERLLLSLHQIPKPKS